MVCEAVCAGGTSGGGTGVTMGKGESKAKGKETSGSGTGKLERVGTATQTDASDEDLAGIRMIFQSPNSMGIMIFFFLILYLK